MNRTMFVLLVTLIAAAGLEFFICSANSEEPGARLSNYSSIATDESRTVGRFLLVQDRYNSKYGPYHDRLNTPTLPPEFENFSSIYGIPSYDLLKEYLKYGGYIGDPLFRSKQELYNTCLLHSRYTYECQNGEQK